MTGGTGASRLDAVGGRPHIARAMNVSPRRLPVPSDPPALSTTAAVEVAGLTKRFGDTVAVDGIDFSIATGRTVALLGGNGAGKTTTISMLLGLLLPTSGRITVFGIDMVRDRYRVLPRMNFSSPYVDLPHRLTVLQNMTVYAKLYGIKHSARAHRGAGARSPVRGVPEAGRWASCQRGSETRVALAKALAEPARTPAAGRADGVARPRYRRLDPHISGALPGRNRRHHHAGLPQHGRGGAALPRRGDAAARSGGRSAARPRTLVARYGRADLEEVFLEIARRARRAQLKSSTIRVPAA